jgi:putative two-component system response regulator
MRGRYRGAPPRCSDPRRPEKRVTKPSILIVDDNVENLTVLGELLREHYQVRAANSGARALQLLARPPLPDLVLLDVMMPGISGHDVLATLRADPATRELPVVFITALDALEDEERGLAMGAVDYITKPLKPSIVLARVGTQLALKQARDNLQRINHSLEAEIERRMQENLMVQDMTIRALARLAETRDNDTGQHILRTQEYVRTLALLARRCARFEGQLGPQQVDTMVKSAPMHDIGKVGIPDHILLKPGKLDAAEWEVMKTHAELGADAIERALADMPRPLDFLTCARDIARHHHERWDGSGYPGGLAGDAIPLSARLMAVADVFDALISRRVYKEPMPFDEVCRIMYMQRGRQFDPDLLDAFIDNFDTFCDIARSLPDEREPGTLRTATAARVD